MKVENLESTLKVCNISTWQAECFNLPVGFTKEMRFLDSFEEKKDEGDTLKTTLLAGGDVLLDEIKMEVEVRDSDFMTMATANELVSTEIEVYLDKASVI